ncbi:hypothetical protein D3C72_1826880 [compost metagenome]
MGAEAIGQLAQQIQHRPGCDHHQQLRQERLLCTQELRQESREEKDVFRIAGTEHERAAEQCAKARNRRCQRHFSTVGRLARLLPALPGEVEQVQRADDFQSAEQLFRRQQQSAQTQCRGAQQAD